MYRLLALAKYDERYVIPPAHAEQAHALEELATECALDYEGGPGMGGRGPSARGPGRPRRSRWRTSRCSRTGRPPTPWPPRRPVRPGEPAQLGRQGHPAGPVPAEGRVVSPRRGRPYAAGRAAPADPRVAVGLAAARLPRRGAARPARPGAACRAGAARRRGRAAPATAVDGSERRALTELQADYVETFDTRRRHNLFLTYFAHGDTRKRGVALLRFKQTYLRSGFVLDASGDAGELPDHLCVVLEYAALVDQRLGLGLLLDHRAGLELLRLSLRDAGSRWAGAVEAVTATLPPLRGDEWDAVRRLAAEGPPEEEVGLTPYATPAFDPGPAAPGVRPSRSPGGRSRCRCRRSPEVADGRGPLGGRPLRLPDRVRGRPRVALPLRQVRLDHPVLPALRGPAAAAGQPAVPLRDPRGLPRTRHGARGPEVVDRGGRRLRGGSTTSSPWPSAPSPGSARWSAWRS